MATIEENKRREAARKISNRSGTVKQRTQGGVGGRGASLGDASGVSAQSRRNPINTFTSYENSLSKKSSPNRVNTFTSYGEQTPPTLVRDVSPNPINTFTSYGEQQSVDRPERTTDLTGRSKWVGVSEDTFRPGEAVAPGALSQARTLPTVSPTASEDAFVEGRVDPQGRRHFSSLDAALEGRPDSPGQQGGRLGAYDSSGNEIGEGAVSSIGRQGGDRTGGAAAQLAAMQGTSFGGDRTVDTFGTSARDALPSEYSRGVSAHNKRVDLGMAMDDLRRQMQRGGRGAAVAAKQYAALSAQRAGTYDEAFGTEDELAASELDEATRSNLAEESLGRGELAAENREVDSALQLGRERIESDYYTSAAAQYNKDRKYQLDVAKYGQSERRAALGEGIDAEKLAIQKATLATKLQQLGLNETAEGTKTSKRVMDVMGNMDIDEDMRFGYAVSQLGPTAAIQSGLVTEDWVKTRWKKDEEGEEK